MTSDMESLKKHRTNVAKVVNSNIALKVFNRVQEEETAHFLLHLLDSPEKLFDHIRKEAGAVILKITYGYNVEQHGRDHLVEMAGQTMADFSDACTPGKWPVDMFPLRECIQQTR
jgi:hypothetical protein